MTDHRRLKIKIRDRRVYRGSEFVTLTSKQFTMFCAIYFRGTARKEDIFDAMYGNDIDGGPLDGLHILDVFTNHINRRIRKIGAAIITPRYGFREIIDVARSAA